MRRRSLLLMSLAGYFYSSTAFSVLAGTTGAKPAKGKAAVGLSGIADWGASQPFIDVFKQSREWMARSETAFVSHTNDQLREGGHLDDDGWPVSIPAGAKSVGSIILTDLSAKDTSVNGHYRMTWDGQGTIQIGGTGQNVTQGEGWAEFDYTASDTGIVLIDITRQDSSDPARNFRCINQSLQADYDAGGIFRPDWLALLTDFRLLRFMDWMATNNSSLSEWSDRPRLSSATWTLGVPVEAMVTLANLLQSDPWFCMPHLATDDYITSFATYVRDNLNPALVAHYEYSNEVWNFQFEQAQWALKQAEARWPDQGDGWMQVYGGRSADMAVLLDAVHGDEPARYRKVITAHTAWVDLNHAALDAPLWVAEGADRKPPKTHFDAYAVTGYFDGGLGRPENIQQIRSWREQGDAEAFTLMAEQIMDGRHIAGEAAGTTMEILEEKWKAQKDIARDADLALVMYEGGSHIVVDYAAIENDPELLEFYTRFHYSEQMGQLYHRALTAFEAAGGEFFNVFVEVAGPGPSGFWGARRYVADDNPRWRAIADYNAS